MLEHQPKYKLGSEVKVKLYVKNTDVGFETSFDVEGIVTGVLYDPKDGTSGGPYFRYNVLIKNATHQCCYRENDISPRFNIAGCDPNN